MSHSAASEENQNPLAAGAWTTLYEDLVAGIIHSMNNAITVLSVSLELASPGDVLSEMAGLRREIGHLEQLTTLAATLSSRSARDEALELRAVMDVALVIHALNPATRTVKCALQITGEIPPVRVPRAVLMRVILMLIDGAKRSSAGTNSPVQIHVTGDADRVNVRAPFTHEPSEEMMRFAGACGGTLEFTNGSVLLELPSLQRLRRASTKAPAETN